jgi:2-amino-4-hydroxy-6-hydroxymethyldihydropteridine diphosphokinase
MHLETKTVYLLLGSNLGDRETIIRHAIKEIEGKVGEIASISSLYETAAWGNEDQPAFFNIALGIKTALGPHEILVRTLKIEEELGRVRSEKWGARLIDIDIILYADEVVSDETLQIPHPRMQERKFVLEPLAEIAGEVYHPLLRQNISNLLSLLKDNLAVTRIP